MQVTGHAVAKLGGSAWIAPSVNKTLGSSFGLVYLQSHDRQRSAPSRSTRLYANGDDAGDGGGNSKGVSPASRATDPNSHTPVGLRLAAVHRTRHLRFQENHRHRTGYVDNSLPRVLAHTHRATTTALSLRNPMVDPTGSGVDCEPRPQSPGDGRSLRNGMPARRRRWRKQPHPRRPQASRRSPHTPPAIPGKSPPPHWICG